MAVVAAAVAAVGPVAVDTVDLANAQCSVAIASWVVDKLVAAVVASEQGRFRDWH